MREALNLGVDRHGMAAEALDGYATPLAALTPAWCGGLPGPSRAAAIRPGLGNWRPRPAGPRAGPAHRHAGAVRGAGADGGRGHRGRARPRPEVIAVPDGAGCSAAPGASWRRSCRCRGTCSCTPWFDLSSDMPPAVVHREFFGQDGAFRAGPQDAQFDRLFADSGAHDRPDAARRLAEDIDRHCFEQSRRSSSARRRRCTPSTSTSTSRPTERRSSWPTPRSTPPSTGRAGTTNLNRLRVVPTGAAHLGSILRAP